MIRQLLLAATLLASPLAAQTVAITGGKVATGDGSPAMEVATVLIRDGRIAAVGAGVAVPAGAQVIDATGKWVTPGLIGGFTRLGLVEVDAVDQTNDVESDKSPFSAAIDVAPGINPASVNLAINRIDGVTRAVVAPAAGDDIFGGQGALISLADSTDAVMRPRAFQFIELGEAGARIAGGSRGAAFTQFRNALVEAKDYVEGKFRYDMGAHREAVLNKADTQALVPVLRGQQKALIHVERASDIRRVLELRREFPALDIVIVGASEGWLAADALAAAKVPVIVTGINNLPSRFETLGATQSNVGRLLAAGVTVALGMIDEDDGRQIRLLPQHAGNLVAMGRIPGATGVTREQALSLMTAAPARIFDMADLGTLAAGKRADVVVWDGDPLELASAPSAVFIDGKSVALVSRQTKLADRYHPRRPRELPDHYRRN
jgi:imidazolonepropionase-like amidohydrolase